MMEFIEAYNKETGKTFIIPELEIQSEEELDDFLTRQRPSISRAIAVAAELLVELKLEHVPCFAIKDIDVTFNLNREDADYRVFPGDRGLLKVCNVNKLKI